jgi:DNA-directed RNA polymerase subunit F
MFGKKIRISEDEALNDKEWKARLASKSGLFKPIDWKEAVGRQIDIRQEFPGPHYNDETGQILGDQLNKETMMFNAYASSFQRRLFEELQKQDASKANEYLLHIVGALEHWKEDIKVLQDILKLLPKEEELVERELEFTSEMLERLPEILERYLPDVFRTLKGHLQERDVRRYITDLKWSDEHFRYVERCIRAFLGKLKSKEHLEFLFE